MKVSLQKSMFGVMVLITFLLIMTLLLGVFQYRLASRHDKIIEQSEQLLFRYATLREQLIKHLINRDWQSLAAASSTVEDFNGRLNQLLETSIIPVEYKLRLSEGLDPAGLVLLTQEIASRQGDDAKIEELQDRLRLLGNHIMAFDRIIVGWVKAKVLRFQKMVIGALALSICLISLILLVLYQKIVLPVNDILGQLQSSDPDTTRLKCSENACREVTELAQECDNLLRSQSQKENPVIDLGLQENEIQNQLNGIINYAQIVLDNEETKAPHGEQAELLRHIIKNGEQVSMILRQTCKGSEV